MQLRKVLYRVFEHEKGDFGVTGISSWHQLDGEILLLFYEGGVEYISWGSEPEQYCIQRKNQSFFAFAAFQELDVSDHPYWRDLLGKPFSYEFKDAKHQVLEIRAGTASVFLSSQYDNGMFLGDCVRVSNAQPLLEL